MYFIIKCWDTKCHDTSGGNFHTKYHVFVEPNRVRHWAQQILQVTGSTNSSVQVVFLLLIHITSRTGETKSGTS